MVSVSSLPVMDRATALPLTDNLLAALAAVPSVEGQSLSSRQLSGLKTLYRSAGASENVAREAVEQWEQVKFTPEEQQTIQAVMETYREEETLAGSGMNHALTEDTLMPLVSRDLAGQWGGVPDRLRPRLSNPTALSNKSGYHRAGYRVNPGMNSIVPVHKQARNSLLEGVIPLMTGYDQGEGSLFTAPQWARVVSRSQVTARSVGVASYGQPGRVKARGSQDSSVSGGDESPGNKAEIVDSISENVFGNTTPELDIKGISW